MSRVRFLGERPEPARVTTFLSCGSQIMAKQSPPMPQEVGSTEPRTALVATAASMAEPPFFRISIAVRVARGCAVPAAPLQPIAAEREAKLAPAMRSPAWTSGRSNFSAPAGWNFGTSLDVVPSLWPKAFDELMEAMEPAAARGSAAMKERRRKFGSPKGGWKLDARDRC